MKFSKILIIVNLIIGYILSAFITGIMALEGAFGNGVFDDITKGMLSKETETLIFFLAIGFLLFFALNLIYLPIYIIKLFLLSKDIINKKYVDTKESIYTRDLPEYNSAVAGEMLDFKTTFEEEYIACIMELVAKGYIIEDENGFVVDNSKSTEGLLRNEKYILKTCENINYNSYPINNYAFYRELKEDIEIYKRGTFLKELKNKIEYYIKKDNKQSVVITIYIIMMLLPILFFMIIDNFILMIMLYLVIIVLLRKNKLTKEGELEKERMSKLKLFLEKEMNFQEKGKEERKIWDRYSAFAVAFGLNTKMMEEMKNKILKRQWKHTRIK